MKKATLGITITYFLIGILWALSSNELILKESESLQELTYLQNYKDIFFILLTTALLFLLIKAGFTKVRESEQQYRKLFEDNPQPMWIYSRDSLRFLAVNEAALKQYGYSEEEFMNMSLLDIRPKEDIAQLNETLKVSADITQLNENLVFRHRRKSGEIFYVQISSQRTIFKGKKARLVVALDIDEKHKNYQKVKELNLRLKNIQFALTASSIVITLDRKGTITYVNQQFTDLYQTSRGDMIAQNFSALSNSMDPPLVKAIRRQLKFGNLWEGEVKIVNKKGNIRWVDLKIIPIQNTQKVTEEYILIGFDITEKKQTEERLQFREKLFSSLINSQTNFLIRIDTNGCFSYANPRYLKTFYRTEGELIGSHYQQTLLAEDVPAWENVMEACIQRPSTIQTVEIRVTDTQGKEFWTEWEFTGISNEAGKVVELQGVGRDISEEKLAERELKKSTRQVSNLLENMTDGFFALDEEQNLILANTAFERMLHLNDQELDGKKITELISRFPFNEDAIQEQLNKVIQTGRATQVELMYSEKGNWMQLRLYPLNEGICGFVNDITQRKQDELRLKHALERYEIVSMATNDVVWDWDLTTDKISWNKAIQTSMKYKLEEVGNDIDWWAEHVHPDDHHWVISGIHQTIQEGNAHWEGEYRFLCADGEYRYFYDRGYVMYDEDGKPIRMISTMQDIHQQRIYQEEIDKLSLVARKTKNGVVITDKDGLAEWVNDGFTRISGYTLEEVRGRKPGNLLQGKLTDPETVQLIRDKLRQQVDFSAEIVNYRKDGTPHWIRMDISPIFQEGELIKFIGITTEITERKQFEEKLKQQNEQLKEIAWISSHDVRRPVASILGLISLYDKESPLKDFNYEILDHLSTCAQELDHVIRKIVFKTYEVSDIQEEDKARRK